MDPLPGANVTLHVAVVVLTPRDCAVLSRVLTGLSRPDRVGAQPELLALVEEIARAGRVHREMISDLGSSELPLRANEDRDPDDEWVGCSDVATTLGVTSRRVRQLCAEGQLRAVRTHGRYWRIRIADLEELERRRQ